MSEEWVEGDVLTFGQARVRFVRLDPDDPDGFFGIDLGAQDQMPSGNWTRSRFRLERSIPGWICTNCSTVAFEEPTRFCATCGQPSAYNAALLTLVICNDSACPFRHWRAAGHLVHHGGYA